MLDEAASSLPIELGTWSRWTCFGDLEFVEVLLDPRQFSKDWMFSSMHAVETEISYPLLVYGPPRDERHTEKD